VRIGELLGLQWDDLDERRDLLPIAGGVSFRKGELIIDTTKNHQRRTIDVPRALMRKIRARVARGDAGPWVFPSERDPSRPMNDGWFRNRVWMDARRRAREVAREYHGAPRASHLRLDPAATGVPMPYASRQAGHSSIAVTVDLYGHFEPRVDRHHVVGLADAIEVARRWPHEGADPTSRNYDSTTTSGRAALALLDECSGTS